MQPASRNEVIRLARLAGSPGCFYPVMRGARRRTHRPRGSCAASASRPKTTAATARRWNSTVRGRSESFRAEADTAAVALYPDRTSARAGRTRGPGQRPRRGALRTYIRETRTPRDPAGRFGRRGALARLPVPQPRHTAAASRSRHRPHPRTAAAAIPDRTGRAQPQRPAGVGRRLAMRTAP